MAIVVPGEGNPKARWAVVGEAPGEDEARQGRPFVGKTGREQDAHLLRGGLHRRDGWFTNTVFEFIHGNPSPTPERIAEWRPRLERELLRVRPRFIIAAGVHAARWFLGEDTHIEAVHGIPHAWTLGDYTTTVIPTYHPAAHFYDPDALAYIVYDYNRATDIIAGRADGTPVHDAYGTGDYWDLDSCPHYRRFFEHEFIGLDTEGVPGDEWSLQVTTEPGVGLVVRRESKRYGEFMAAFRKHLRRERPTLVIHNSLYDIEMVRGFGLNLLDYPIFDTMMAAYLLCIEPQSLKNLARRHCGMKMRDYSEVVGDIGKQKQMDYLDRVMTAEWPEVEPRIVHENDGSDRIYKPKNIGVIAQSIWLDVTSGKVNKEGEPTDPFKRWRDTDSVQRRMVEKVFGKMPVGTLADIPLRSAVYYSGRDPDAVIRLYPIMVRRLEEEGLTDLMKLKMGMLPAAAEIKMNGIMGEYAAFEELAAKVNGRMDKIVRQLSKQFYGGNPINPNSGDQVANLMRKRGLEGEKRSKKTKKMSTSKKSIEHLRFEDPAIELVEQWRELAKVRDSFAGPMLERWPDPPPPVLPITGDLKISRVTSGRFSMTAYRDRPSAPLLAIPQRTEIGREVRQCYVAEEGYVLGGWDLDQAEMRIMADESGDEVLCKIFNDGKIDVHSSTASKIFGVPYKQLEEDKSLRKKYRDPAKRAGFGVITGIQAQGLYDQMRMAGATGWDVDSTGKLIRDWFKVYPGVKDYMEWCKDLCRKNNGVIYDRWGMKRHLQGVFSEDKFVRWEAERQTHSHRIQGGAQGLLQNVMAWLYPRLLEYGDLVRWRLQVHDELILSIYDDEDLKKEIFDLMVHAMTKRGAKLKVPVKSSGSYAYRWGELK